jgi:hypothetical protein
LFHPVFGYFLDDLSSNLPAPAEVAKETVRYMQAASEIYGSEIYRGYTLELRLNHVLAIAMGTVLNADRRPPGAIDMITLSGEIRETVVTLLWEDKNDFGDGGFDPSTQAGLSAVQFWAQPEVDKYRFSVYSCPL